MLGLTQRDMLRKQVDQLQSNLKTQGIAGVIAGGPVRHAQQMPKALPPDSGNDPKFRFNGKIIVQLLAAAGIIYIGYHIL